MSNDLPALRWQLKIKSDCLRSDRVPHPTVPLSRTWMLEESEKMFIDSKTRLAKAHEALRDLVVSTKKETALAEDEDFLKAKGILEEISV
ncbi:hypothetical protein C8J57DRAFT_1516658 [Mycena rebaudengoi]|nr:hypothetical protein C8J57DRAFT_1516658 [Mycena rebaudengoi]